MQNDGQLPLQQRRNYKHALDGVVRIAREEGITSLFRGLGPNMNRAILMTSSQCVSYDTFKDLLLRYSPLQDGLILHFTSSTLAVSRAERRTNDSYSLTFLDRVWWPRRCAHLWMWSKRGLWQPVHLIERCPPSRSCQACIGTKAWLHSSKDGHQHLSAWPHKPSSPLSYWNSSRNGMRLGTIGNFWWQRFRLLFIIILPSYRHSHHPLFLLFLKHIST